jgi:hypothetical protein
MHGRRASPGYCVDILQGPAQDTARRQQGVWDVDDLDADGREIPLQLITLPGGAPIATLEENIEPQLAPDFKLVNRRLRKGGVDEVLVAR